MADQEQKKTRTMTIKRFIGAKLSGKTTAEGFLAAHMGFLRNHTFLSDILDAYDRKELLPTPTLQAVQSALLAHMLESEIKTAEAKMAKQKGAKPKKGKKAKGAEDSDGEEGETSAYTITLMCKVTDKSGTRIEVGTVEEIVGYKIRTPQGDIEVDTREQVEGRPILEVMKETHPAEYEADDYGAAMRIADRHLFQREDSVYAVIVNNIGKPIQTHVQRGDAIARMLKVSKGAVSRTRGRSTKTLGFQPHAKQTRVTGPWSGR